MLEGHIAVRCYRKPEEIKETVPKKSEQRAVFSVTQKEKTQQSTLVQKLSPGEIAAKFVDFILSPGATYQDGMTKSTISPFVPVPAQEPVPVVEKSAHVEQKVAPVKIQQGPSPISVAKAEPAPEEAKVCCLCCEAIYNTPDYPYYILGCRHTAHNFCMVSHEDGAYKYSKCMICDYSVTEHERKYAFKWLTPGQ